MKLQIQLFSKILLCSLAAVFVSAGCTSERSGDGFHKVQIPWPDAQGNYSVQKIQLTTLTNSTTMHGEAATMKVQRGYRGPAPEAQFIKDSDGTLIPSDFNTMQMAVVYAHLEKLMFLEERLGFSNLLPRPRRVTIEYPMVENGKAIFDNALYYPAWDSLIILPFRKREIPISMNGGILAHEHFHSIFQHTMGFATKTGLTPVLSEPWAEKGQPECGARMETLVSFKATGKANDAIVPQVIYRALNEGLADFWGWLYTQDESFIAKSIPKLELERKVSLDSKPLPDAQFFDSLSKVGDASVLMDASYCLGTHYSRFMRRMAEVYGAEAIATKLIKNMKTARKQSDFKIDPAMLSTLLFQDKDLKSCDELQKFFGDVSLQRMGFDCPVREEEP